MSVPDETYLTRSGSPILRVVGVAAIAVARVLAPAPVVVVVREAEWRSVIVLVVLVDVPDVLGFKFGRH